MEYYFENQTFEAVSADLKFGSEYNGCTFTDNVSIIQSGIRFYNCIFEKNVFVGGDYVLICGGNIKGDITFDMSRNSVVIGSTVNSALLKNSEFITFADNTFVAEGAAVNCEGSNDILLNVNRYNDEVYSAKDFGEKKCGKIYGNDVYFDEYTEAGADMRKIPTVQNYRFNDIKPIYEVTIHGVKYPSIKEYIYEMLEKNKKVIVPPGNYLVKKGSRGHFEFDGVRDSTLYAYGVLFTLEAYPQTGFLLNKCIDFKIKGPTVDHVLVANTQGTVTAINGDRFTVKFAKGYPNAIDDSSLYCCTVDTRYMVEWFHEGWDRPYQDGMHSFVSRISDTELIFKHTNKLGKPDGRERIGDRIIFKGRPAQVNRFEYCDGIVYEDFTMWNGSHFGLLEYNGGRHTTFNRVLITPGPRPAGADEDRLISVCDSSHSTNMREGIHAYNCYFEKMSDDATNQHGFYGEVTSLRGTRVLYKQYRNRANAPDFEIGDTVAIMTYKGKMLYRGKALSQTIHTGESCEIFIENGFEMPDELVIIANTSRNSNGFVFDNCVSNNNRSRGLVIKASNGTVRHCTMDNNGMSGIICRAEIFDGWGECGFASNILIEKNLVRNSGFYSGVELDSPINISVDIGSISDVTYHNQKNITVRGNKVVDRYTEHALTCSGGSNIKIEDNEFGVRVESFTEIRNPCVNPLYMQNDDTAPVISLRGADRVTVAGNTYPKSCVSHVICDENCSDILNLDL